MGLEKGAENCSGNGVVSDLVGVHDNFRGRGDGAVTTIWAPAAAVSVQARRHETVLRNAVRMGVRISFSLSSVDNFLGAQSAWRSRG